MELNRRTLSEQIYDYIKQEILSHRVGFGAKLINRDLQQRFNVSSTPVRDAINRLFTDGLIEDISKTGARVISFDLKSALDINEVMAMLDCAAIRSCIEQGMAASMNGELRGLLEQQKASVSSEEYIRLDRAFHEVFFRSAGNIHLREIYERYVVLQEMLVRYFYDYKGNKEISLAQHEAIIDALVHRDTALAYEWIERHYRDAAEVFRENL